MSLVLAEIDGALAPVNGRIPAVLYDAAGVAVDVAALIAANASQRWLATAWRTTPDLAGSGTAIVYTPDAFNIWDEGAGLVAASIMVVMEMEATITATTADAVVAVRTEGLTAPPSAGIGVQTGGARLRRWRSGPSGVFANPFPNRSMHTYIRLGVSSATSGGSWTATGIRSRILYLPL